MRRPIARDINQRRQAASTAVSSWLNFTPASLTSVIAWWDASDDSTFTFSSGTSVSQWNSKIGSYAIAQATSTKQPSRSGLVNGLSSVVFDGSSDGMSTTTTFDMTGGQLFSIWFVGSTATTGVDQIVFEQTTNYNNTAGAFIIALTTGQSPYVGKRGTGPGQAYSTFVSSGSFTTTPKIFVATHDGTLAVNESSGWLNLDTAGTRTNNDNTASNNLNATLYVGARNTVSFYFNGSICEFGICTTALTQSQVQALSQYLRNKWAIQF